MNAREQVLIGIDLGTQGLTIAAYTRSGHHCLGKGHATYTERQGLAAGCVEQIPDDWLTALQLAARELNRLIGPDAVANIAGIGIGAQMHGAILRDEHMTSVHVLDPSYPACMLWNDGRGLADAKALRSALGEPIAMRHTMNRCAWVKGHVPGAWARTRFVSVPSSFLGHYLTGQHAVGRGDASGMVGQLNEAGSISRDKLVKAGLPELFDMLPRVVPEGVPIGVLRDDVAAMLGWPAGIPVAPPEGDQPVGMLASGCMLPGQLSISLGTSAVVNAVWGHPVLDKPGLVDSFRTAAGYHLLMTCATSGTEPYDQLIAAHAPPSLTEAVDRYRWATDLAAKVKPGCNGIFYAPFVRGEGVFDYPDGSGCLLGIRMGVNEPGVGTMLRACLEGTAFTMAAGYRAMRIPKPKEIILSGGGSRDKLWPKIIASVFGAPVRIPVEADEAGAFGASLLAELMLRRQGGSQITLAELADERVKLGDAVAPDPADSPPYQIALARFTNAVRAMGPVFSALLPSEPG